MWKVTPLWVMLLALLLWKTLKVIMREGSWKNSKSKNSRAWEKSLQWI